MKLSGRRVALILLPLILLSLALYAREARDRLRASATAVQVERLTLQLQGSGRLSRPDPSVARALEAGLGALRQAALDDPAEVAVPMAQAALYRLLGRPRAAVRAYEEGLGIESRPEIYAQLGHTLWAAGEEEEAREAFRRAVRLDHNLARDLRIYLPELEAQWKKRRQTRRDRGSRESGSSGNSSSSEGSKGTPGGDPPGGAPLGSED